MIKKKVSVPVMSVREKQDWGKKRIGKKKLRNSMETNRANPKPADNQSSSFLDLFTDTVLNVFLLA